MRFSRRVIACAVAAVFLPASGAVHAESWPSRVNAAYKITLAGIELGDFHFESSVTGSSYALAATAELSWGFGAFTWRGVTSSSGTLATAQPKPAVFSFDYKSNRKSGSVKVGFDDSGVSSVVAVPKSTPSPETVPVREHHLKSVLDPMTAILALSRGTTSNPCGRRIAVFDGKQRFDLALSFRRFATVSEARPSGQPHIAFVCRVQYIPVAGYRNNSETQAMASNTGIEVTLRPVPSANLLVPYQITIPTIVGPAVLSSRRVEIVAPDNRQIALIH
ncbi:MAG TPA: DUF3108 domain-containing protein [Hyphomicrobiaceae bacterium]|nr:DUF3108 domain-containing protein [Hyphomicrobiaceae bacterium]